ncbi:MAG: CHAP domain-containing protein [Nitrosotalea sp.]
MLSLSDFIAQYTGKTGQGNTTENMGQCTGLVSLWQDNLGVAHEYGNAKDFLTNADTSKFDVIQNTPDNFPLSSDIIVWGDTWGGGFGHVAIVTQADKNSFISFEQNDSTSTDINGACEKISHPDYSGVLGWLHFKDPSVPMATISQADLDKLRADRDSNYNNWQAALQSLTTKDSTIEGMNSALTAKNASIATLNGQIGTLNSQLQSAQQSADSYQALAIQLPAVQAQLKQALGDRDVCLRAEDEQQLKIAALQKQVDAKMPVGFWNKFWFLLQ